MRYKRRVRAKIDEVEYWKVTATVLDEDDKELGHFTLAAKEKLVADLVPNIGRVCILCINKDNYIAKIEPIPL